MSLCTVYDGAHKRLQKLDSFDKILNPQNANLILRNANLIPRNANLILLMQTWIPQNANLIPPNANLILLMKTWIPQNANLNSTKRKLEFHETKTWISNFVKSKHETWRPYKYHVTLFLRATSAIMSKDQEGKWRRGCKNHPLHRFGECIGYKREATSSKCGNCGCVARCHVSKLFNFVNWFNHYVFIGHFYLPTKNRV